LIKLFVLVAFIHFPY